METESYLKILPDELKLKVCSYLPTMDCIKLSQLLHEYENIILDSHITKYIQLSSDLRFDVEYFKKYISQKVVLQNIYRLNVTNIYWIKADMWIKSIKKMPNLNTLYAADTELDFAHIIENMESLKNLRRISGCFRYHAYSSYEPLKQFTHIFLYYDNVHSHKILSELRSLLKLMYEDKLQAFWVINTSIVNLQNEPVDCNTLVKFKIFSTFRNSKLKYLYFNDTTIDQSALISLMGFYGKSGFYLPKLPNLENQNMEIFTNKNFAEICDIKIVANHLLIHYSDYNDKYSDVSEFRKDICRFLYINGDINNASVQKVAVCYCAWCRSKNNKRKHSDNDHVAQQSFVASSSRSSDINNFNDDDSILIFNDLIKHCPNVKEFDLNFCESGNCREIYCPNLLKQGLSNLHKWTGLIKLYVNFSDFINTEFLIEIFEKCPRLETVKFNWIKPADGLTNYLCKALKNANNLKTFRYQINKINSILNLVSALSECPKLEKLYVFCDNKPTNQHMLLDAIKKLWTNPNLIFVKIIMNITKEHANIIERRMNLTFRTDSKKMFYLQCNNVKQKLCRFEETDFPVSHYRDVIIHGSIVDAFDVYKCYKYY